MSDILVPADILVSAVRYALGRHSYIVQETCDAVKVVWPNLTPKIRASIAASINDHFERCPPAPDDSDSIAWADLLTFARASLS